jgi:DTW domain-containing protein YfiP
LTALLYDPRWQPVIVFPAEFAPPVRVVTELVPDAQRRPLFILLDGTWAEARKAFRKSPWLDRFPVLALNPRQASRYRLRQSSHAHHLCTSEVAALCLEMAGDARAAQALTQMLELFSERSLLSRFGQRI